MSIDVKFSNSRFAIVSSPRSGNTWFRNMISDLFGLPQLAVHRIDNVSELPDSVVLQFHTYPTKAALEFFAVNGFRVLAIARHPLDILMSVLHFSQHEPQVENWLDGETGAERLLGASPTSTAFYDYALSTGFSHLLNVTPQWKGILEFDSFFFYENLIANPQAELSKLWSEETLAQENIAQSIEEAVDRNSLDRLARESNHHGWKGLVNNWVNYIPASLAQEVLQRNSAAFDELGYSVDQAKELSNSQIDLKWLSNKL